MKPTRSLQAWVRRVGRGLNLAGLIALAAATTAAGGSQSALRQTQARGSRHTIIVPAASVSADCSTDVALCMSDGRFLVEATWTRPDGASGFGHAVRLTEDSGYF